jgi:hypothetical protein
VVDDNDGVGRKSREVLQVWSLELTSLADAPGILSLRSFQVAEIRTGVILLALGWYLRFSLSCRDVEELLAERGLLVGHVTVWRWCSVTPRNLSADCDRGSDQPTPTDSDPATTGQSKDQSRRYPRAGSELQKGCPQPAVLIHTSKTGYHTNNECISRMDVCRPYPENIFPGPDPGTTNSSSGRPVRGDCEPRGKRQ